MVLSPSSLMASRGNDAAVAGVILVVVVLGILSMLFRVVRGQSMLEAWASAQGYEILSQEECWFLKGPFFWNASKNQKVYRVSMRGRDGVVRAGYARCGGYWLGMLSDAVEVRWDDGSTSSQ